ncbi:MAG TPA: hypothetical protein VIH59_04305 [Candidatus Tectomicrobia bacterium]
MHHATDAHSGLETASDEYGWRESSACQAGVTGRTETKVVEITNTIWAAGINAPRSNRMLHECTGIA